MWKAHGSNVKTGTIVHYFNLGHPSLHRSLALLPLSLILTWSPISWCRGRRRGRRWLHPRCPSFALGSLRTGFLCSTISETPLRGHWRTVKTRGALLTLGCTRTRIEMFPVSPGRMVASRFIHRVDPFKAPCVPTPLTSLLAFPRKMAKSLTFIAGPSTHIPRNRQLRWWAYGWVHGLDQLIHCTDNSISHILHCE